MQRPSSYYRDLAARCVLMASEASAAEQKVALLDMARRWSELADQVDKAETQPTNDNEPK